MGYTHEEMQQRVLMQQKAKSKADNNELTIAILSASPNGEATQSIIKAGTKRGHEMIVLDPAHLYLLISDKIGGYDHIYDSKPIDKPEQIPAKNIDAVISRIGSNLEYSAAVLEHFNKNLDIFYTQSANGIKTAADKLISLQKLSQNRIRVPLIVIGDNIIHAEWLINQIGGLPAIAKTLKGSLGIGVIPLKDPQQTNAMLQSFFKNRTNLLLQQYIEAGAHDIRAIVIDHKVVAAEERFAKKGELRSNISLGGSGKTAELSQEDKDLCVKAAEAVELGGACGVDLIKDADGTSYIIECNSNYGYKVEEITGIDISTPLIEYCERNHKKGGIATDQNNAIQNDVMTIAEDQFGYFMMLAINMGIKIGMDPDQDIEVINVEFNKLLCSNKIDLEIFNQDMENFKKLFLENYFKIMC